MKISSARIAAAWFAATLCSALIGACGGSDSADSAATPASLTCDDSMKAAFKPDANTTVALVKAFKKNDPLLLIGSATATTPLAANDMCLVKLLVGPGHSGPEIGRASCRERG